MASDSERTKSLFDAARDLSDPARRRAFLEEACGDDLALRTRIERLLSAGEQADDFLAGCAPALEAAAAALDPSQISPPQGVAQSLDEKPGSRIGPYKLLQKIGEGGGGIVYMAEQERPVRRRVALKVIKLGMDTKTVIARFEAERQALAMMDHPNIARALDAGATEAGRPYFVMELVYGSKITDYCDQNELAVSERLKIFIQVCQGLQHAHQKGIIHRDIKPSNILVTMHDGEPMPKVIDFGIAKATEQSLTDKTLFTAYSQLLGTPAYMSPEQMELSGQNLDTRSDIYCLGVLLYELLTGRTPFDTAELLKGGVDEMRRTLREKEPSSPSAKLRTLSGEELTKTAMQRKVDPRRFPSHLLGDLDRIVMKCLEKNRNRRYETANGLAMDIQRHLNDEPVLARAHSRLYRFQKLVQRNRIVFLSGAAVAAALLLGTIVSTRLFFKERAARTSAERMRRDAEAREKASHIALLVTQRRFDEADKLVADVPLNRPSIEVAAELRALGDWHAANGRWPKAVDRLGSVVDLDQFDGPDLISSDKLKLAAALLKAGDRRGYEQLRQTAVAIFTPKSDPTSYSLVKIGLLLPPEPRMLQSLASAAEPFAARFPTEDELRPNPPQGAQWCEALALLEYRRGHFINAVSWCDRCQGSPMYYAPMISTSLFIKALSNWRLKNYWAAVVDWTEGFELIQARSRNGLDVGTSPSAIFPSASAPEYIEGSWFDWVIASFLMHECNEVIAQTDEAFTPASMPTPLPEKAVMVRALGEWHAIRGEWEQARQRFDYVQHAAQDLSGLDYLNDSIALLELGDEAGFSHLREEAISRFKDTDKADTAQRVLELALLRPISKTSVGGLEPFAQVLAHKLAIVDQNKKETTQYYSWYSMLLGLLEYRRGNHAKALELCRQSIEISNKFVSLPTATDRVILAICLHELGENTAARSELERASSLARLGLNRGFDKWYWHEWVGVRLLLQEATHLMPEESPTKSTEAPR